MNLLRAFIGNHVLASMCTVLIIVCGILAASDMTRTRLPKLELGMVEVSVAYPGANPREVEEGIARLLEARIDGLEGVKSYQTFSSEGSCYAQIDAEQGVDIKDLKDRVQTAVDGIENLPQGARAPRVAVVTEVEEVINVALWGELPERQLKTWAEQVRAELTALPDVSLVSVHDTRNYEINIEVSREALLKHRLTVQQVSEAISRGSLDMSAGLLRAEGEEISIRAVGRRYDGAELEGIPIKAAADGSMITLGEIARVHDAFGDAPAYGSFNGKPAALVEVYMAEGEDIMSISSAVKAYAERKQAELPEGLHLTPCFDESTFVRNQISLLLEDALNGLILVVVVLWLFLSWRLAFWVALGIPVSVCGALVLLWAMDATMNQITLMSFILVTGILVDDAIVIGEAVFHHRSLGKSPVQAAVDGVAEVGVPVIAAVTTMCVAFVPAMFVPGFLGQIMAVVPMVVIACLLISVLEAMFLLPAHLAHSRDMQESARPKGWRILLAPHFVVGDWLQRWTARFYAPVVPFAVKHRYVSACVGIAFILAASGLLTGGIVRMVFWPPVDGDVMAAVVEFPPGTPYETVRNAVAHTREALDRVAAQTETLSGEPLIVNVHERIFQGAAHIGRVYVEFIPPSRRGVPVEQISVAWERETGKIPGAVSQQYYREDLGGGDPPIAIWLAGPDMEELVAAAQELQACLKEMPGVYGVEDDFRPGRRELQVTLKPEAAALGVTMADIAAHLNDGFYGNEAQRLQRGRDEVRVRVRYPLDERRALSDLQSSRVRTPSGAEVPLSSVAEFTFSQGYADIRGTNGQRRIAVLARADSAITSPEAVVSSLRASGFLDQLVSGYGKMRWELRGDTQENEETLSGLLRGFLLALLAVFVVMAITFRSYAQPFVIMLVPFGLIGAVIGHWLLGLEVTMLSMFGLVALAGVVVNDAIVMVEAVNAGIQRGEPFYRALALAGVRRFRPIMLTTVTTFIGLTPMVLEKDLEAQLVIPMCVSIGFGVVFATAVDLVLLPCFLAILNDGRRLVYYLRTGIWPTPDEVEPAAQRHGHATENLAAAPAQAG
jgi:multidrug efflux pump subunit AcrB